MSTSDSGAIRRLLNPYPPVMTVAETAQALACHPQTVYRLVKRKELPASVVATSLIIYREAIYSLLTEGARERAREKAAVAAAFSDYGDRLMVVDVATVLRKKPATIYGWLTSGELPGHNLGNNWLIYRDELVAGLQARLTDPE